MTGRRIDLSDRDDERDEGGTERLVDVEAGARTVRKFQLTHVEG